MMVERELRDELEVPGHVLLIKTRSKDEVIAEIRGILDAYERQGITKLGDLPENVEKVLREDFTLLGLPHTDLNEPQKEG